MDSWLLALVVLVVLLVLVLAWAAVTYSGLLRLRNLVQEAWRQIDVELHRRHALVLTLVETLEADTARERDVLEEVRRARVAATNASAGPAAQALTENQLSEALAGLFAVAQASPGLRAAADFDRLQAELATTEDRIVAGRRFYNAKVRRFNTWVATVPTTLVASAFSFRRADLFEVEDTAAPATPDTTPPAAPEPEDGTVPARPDGHGPHHGS